MRMALLLGLLWMAAPAGAQSGNAPANPPITESQRLRITMLDSVFRFDGRQVDTLDALLHHVKSTTPASIIVSVCAVTHEQQVARLQAALAGIHAGFFEIHRLPQKAVECSWSNSRPPPRNT